MILNIKQAVTSQVSEIVCAVRSSLGTVAGDAVQKKAEDLSDEYIEQSIKSALAAAVVTCDKAAAGVCICNSSPIPDGCEVTDIYIADKMQRKGLGRKLLSHALREMRAQRFKAAFVWINENNVPAVEFIKKIGFEPDGKRRKNAVSSGYDMRFRIDI